MEAKIYKTQFLMGTFIYRNYAHISIFYDKPLVFRYKIITLRFKLFYFFIIIFTPSKISLTEKNFWYEKGKKRYAHIIRKSLSTVL